MDGPKRVNKLLGRGSLGDIRRQAAEHDQYAALLAGAVGELLPAALGDGLCFGNYRGGVLVLFASTAAGATRARFAGDVLVRALRRTPEYAGLKELRIRVRAAPVEPPATAVASRSLSPRARQILKTTGDALPDGPVRRALRRLCGADG